MSKKFKKLAIIFMAVIMATMVLSANVVANAAQPEIIGDKYTTWVDTAAELENAFLQAYGGETIILNDDIYFQHDSYQIQTDADGDVVLDLNGYSIFVYTDKESLIDLSVGDTHLHIVNSEPSYVSSVELFTDTADASVVSINNPNSSLSVYEGADLCLNAQASSGVVGSYNRTATIRAKAFKDIRIIGSDILNLAENGSAVELITFSSTGYANSTFEVTGNAKLQADTYAIYLSDAYDYPKFEFGHCKLDCGEAYYTAICDSASSTTAMTNVKYADMCKTNTRAYTVSSSGSTTNVSDKKLSELTTKADMVFYVNYNPLGTCSHVYQNRISTRFCHVMECNKCFCATLSDAHTYVAAEEPTYTANGHTAGYDCYCGYKTTTEIPKLVKNGWFLEGDKWAYYVEGSKVVNDWMLDSVGWCYLGADGYMVTNSWIMDSVGWCYVGADGYCLTNCWMADSVGWCYLDENGRMATNQWIMDSVGWCYVGADGYCLTNCWMADSVGWCYLDADGRMVTNGWVKDSYGWCWLDENGYWNGIYY